MMFYYVKIDKEVLARLSRKHYSVEQLDYMHQGLQLQVNSKKHSLRRTALRVFMISIALIVSLVVLLYMQTINLIMFWIGLCAVLTFIICALVSSWFFVYGYMMYRFNQCLRNGYPELIEKYRLK